jgi:hypothetical protein
VAFVLVLWGRSRPPLLDAQREASRSQLWVRGFGLWIGLWLVGIPVLQVVPQLGGLRTEYKPHYMWAFDEVAVIVIAQVLGLLIVLIVIAIGRLFSIATGGCPGPARRPQFM